MTATVPEISIHDDVTVGSFKLPEGYTMGTLGFSGTIDGIPVTANGTVEQIMEKTKRDHPNWTPPNWAYQSRSSIEAISSRSGSTIDSITARDSGIFLTGRSKVCPS
ncbi:hypothetical protein IFR04_005681 [Cadophora malorum]|uniref:Uncharacterized protein n=1 Tax=Cadophora malorum TaxID=108018 RepID=A0A8H7TLM1_9HELO|nr:hypothetical protein IFR04_005681 [Cadophora malorum]